MNKTDNKERFNLVLISKYRNELFGLSIISIMIFHYFDNYYNSSLGENNVFAEFMYSVLGSYGVEVFLFLSGMGLYFAMRKNSAVGRFYKRRLVRVLIPYAVWGGVYWLIKDVLIKKPDFGKFFYDFSFMSFWCQGVRRLWYIGLIIVLYLVFPLIFKVINSKKYSFIKTVALIAGVIVFNILLDRYGDKLNVIIQPIVELFQQEFTLPNDVYKNIEIATCRIPIFIVGAYMGRRIYDKDKFKWCDTALIIAGIVAFVYSFIRKYNIIPGLYGIGRYEAALFSISIIYGFVWVLSKIKWEHLNRFLVYVGAMSLELYMTHVTINNLLTSKGVMTECIEWYFFCILLAVVFSILLHKGLAPKPKADRLPSKPAEQK